MRLNYQQLINNYRLYMYLINQTHKLPNLDEEKTTFLNVHTLFVYISWQCHKLGLGLAQHKIRIAFSSLFLRSRSHMVNLFLLAKTIPRRRLTDNPSALDD